MTTQKRSRDLETAEELLAWANSLDTKARESAVGSSVNRKTAAAMIEAAKAEALPTQHRGGRRTLPRRELMPWEAAAVERSNELIEAALRGRLTRRTGELRRKLAATTTEVLGAAV
jgi:hypothetical protein